MPLFDLFEGSSRFGRQAVVFLRLHVRHLREDGREVLPVPASRALAQHSPGLQHGDFFRDRARDEGVQRDALAFSNGLRLEANGLGERDGELAHDSAKIRTNSPGVTARMPMEATPAKCRTLWVTI